MYFYLRTPNWLSKARAEEINRNVVEEFVYLAKEITEEVEILEILRNRST
jgi:hypothetical protein